MDQAILTLNVYVQTDTPGVISEIAAELEHNQEWTGHLQDLIIQAVSAALAGKFELGQMLVGARVTNIATNIGADRGETVH